MYVWTLDSIRKTEKISQNGSVSSLPRQLIRSATSIGANYIEAQAASSRKDLTNYIHISLKSASESKFWLSLLRDLRMLTLEDASKFLEELDEMSKILTASLLSLKAKR
jgi:four helix bundle protein